jgi:branched-chain amino acid aminotransferase
MVAAGEGCICVDGRLLAPREATVSALDAGFLLGDGLFESLRASGGVPYLLDRHLERLYAGAAELGFEGMSARERLAEQTLATLARAGLDDAYVRITVTRGLAGPPPASAPTSPTVVIAALPTSELCDPADGIRVALVGPPPRHGPKAKSTSRQAAVVARRHAERVGAREGIYVSSRGRVLEGTSSNVFALVEGRLLTPPAEDCLPGITRGRVLELARAEGIDAVEAPLAVETLMRAEQAFVTNAVQGLRAIGSVDDRALLRAEGGVFARLAGLYEVDRRLPGPLTVSG